MRRENSEAVRTVMEMNIEGGKGRPMKNWLDVIGYDMRGENVGVEDVGDHSNNNNYVICDVIFKNIKFKNSIVMQFQYKYLNSFSVLHI